MNESNIRNPNDFNKLKSNYELFYCGHERYTKSIDNKITKHEYNTIPTHQVLLKNDITFFNNANYSDELNSTKASFCFIEEKFTYLV